jgi:hypothetical protein
VEPSAISAAGRTAVVDDDPRAQQKCVGLV